MLKHETDGAAVEKAAGTEAPTPAFLKRDKASIDALAERATAADRGGPALSVTDKLALELAVAEGLIKARPEESAQELIARGIRESADRHAEAAVAGVGELEKIATQVAGVRIKPDWFSLREKLEATAKTAELRVEFDKLVWQVEKEHLNHLSPDPRHDDLRKTIADHLRVLRAAFDRPFRES